MGIVSQKLRDSACGVDGCTEPLHARGWCVTHYHLWRRNGDPTKRLKAPHGEPLRYLNEVVLTYDGTECLTWPYARSGGKKAVIEIHGKMFTVARLVCEAHNGPPPTPGHEAAHSCGKGHLACVAKHHLRWATTIENMADKIIHGTAPRGENNPNSRAWKERRNGCC